jgi:tagatose 6-phosphate kinase
MSGDVIITVTLNTALHVSYTGVKVPAGVTAPTGASVNGGVVPVSRPSYQAGGRGVMVARVLHKFGHDVLAAGLAGGAAGELIGHDLSRSGVPAEFTHIRGESRRIFAFVTEEGNVQRFGEPGPYITTEELGRFAADYRRLLASAAAVVLCGSLPDGLPPDMYASLVRYAREAGVPVILDAGGEELLLAVRNHPDLAVAAATEPLADQDLLRQGAACAVVLADDTVRVATPSAAWTARVSDAALLDRGALVAGLVPGELLGWSWPDRLRHALALAASAGPSGEVDLLSYERLLDKVQVDVPQ